MCRPVPDESLGWIRTAMSRRSPNRGRITSNHRPRIRSRVIDRMSLHYTPPMRRVLTADVEFRIEQSLAQFPELTAKTIRVGLTRSADGTAEAERMTIRLNVRKRRGVSYFTIGHELTHLLQSGGLGLIPSGEVPCDIWTLARGDLFLDDRPTYLCGSLWTRHNWPCYSRTVRDLCVQAIELRRTNRRYLVWLSGALKQVVTAPVLPRT